MDIEKFRSSTSNALFRRKRKNSVTRQWGRYIKGPLQLDWFIKAAQLPGKSLHVGLALWYQAGLTRSTEVRCPMSMLTKQMGVSRHSVYRALIALEKALLMTVERHPGRKPVCRLCAQAESMNGVDSGRPESIDGQEEAREGAVSHWRKENP